ncbi:MarR family transcriptional regulator [Mycolicibacterium sp. CH28]|uniref:MarR family winged helix-turn-helix transcriptional regulator n=1 Tax=Mycolicibacterium sp. CH28 TaxID=2512237 RepID=UPI00108187D3|nr:MarR family transcriptional regulator [Mycolicibacterium sp. CH28]TGD90572.1 MarR family transcriptional regulator [Mycolicibacterium sp. CH28]
MESLHASFDDVARELVRVLGVNQTDRRALELILCAGEKITTPGLLADQLGLTAAGTTIALDRLEKLGYVTRSQHPTDHRRVIVVATELAARRVTELLSPLLNQGGKVLFSHYNPAEIALIIDFLTRTDELQQAHVHRMRELNPYPH